MESQVYVGAFQYLLHKQKLADQNRNEGNDKSMELQQLMILAKNLLCEIETAINNTRQLMPTVLSRKAMDHRLTFRNNNSNRFENRDVDDLDNKFTKVRFHEYLHNMLHVMRRPGKKNLRQRKKKRNQMKQQSSQINSSGADGDPIMGGGNWASETRLQPQQTKPQQQLRRQQNSHPNQHHKMNNNGNRNRLKKRNRMGRHQHNLLRDSNDLSWASDMATINNQLKGNGNGLKQENGGMRRNNRNKMRRMRQDWTIEERNRKRLHRRRTTKTPNVPIVYVNNSE